MAKNTFVQNLLGLTFYIQAYIYKQKLTRIKYCSSWLPSLMYWMLFNIKIYSICNINSRITQKTNFNIEEHDWCIFYLTSLSQKYSNILTVHYSSLTQYKPFNFRTLKQLHYLCISWISNENWSGLVGNGKVETGFWPTAWHGTGGD